MADGPRVPDHNPEVPGPYDPEGNVCPECGSMEPALERGGMYTCPECGGDRSGGAESEFGAQVDQDLHDYQAYEDSNTADIERLIFEDFISESPDGLYIGEPEAVADAINTLSSMARPEDRKAVPVLSQILQVTQMLLKHLSNPSPEAAEKARAVIGTIEDVVNDRNIRVGDSARELGLQRGDPFLHRFTQIKMRQVHSGLTKWLERIGA